MTHEMKFMLAGAVFGAVGTLLVIVTVLGVLIEAGETIARAKVRREREERR